MFVNELFFYVKYQHNRIMMLEQRLTVSAETGTALDTRGFWLVLSDIGTSRRHQRANPFVQHSSERRKKARSETHEADSDVILCQRA